MVLVSEGALGVPKFTSKPYPKINKIFSSFLLQKWPPNATKRAPIWTQNGIKKSNKKLMNFGSEKYTKIDLNRGPNVILNVTKNR